MDSFKSRIWIEGKGTYDVLFTPVPGQSDSPITGNGTHYPIPASPAVNIPPATQRPVSTGDGDVFSGMLVKHEMKSGVIAEGKKRAGEPWEKHSFRGSDNRWYVTFDEKITAVLAPLVGQGTPVKLVAKDNAFKSRDIVRILGA